MKENLTDDLIFNPNEDAEELTISKKQQWRCPKCHGIHPLLYTGSGTGVIEA